MGIVCLALTWEGSATVYMLNPVFGPVVLKWSSCMRVQHCTSVRVCQFVFAHTYNNSCKARYMQIYIAAATVFQPTFFFCVLFWTWYFCPPTDLLLCSWKILNGNRDDSLDPKWCKWEHVFRTIERKCIPGDTQDTCCCRAWGDTCMILLLPWGTDSH